MLENPAAAAAARVLSSSSHAAASHQPTSGSRSDLKRGAEGAIGEAQRQGADELAHSARKKNPTPTAASESEPQVGVLSTARGSRAAGMMERR